MGYIVIIGGFKIYLVNVNCLIKITNKQIFERCGIKYQLELTH